MRLYLLLAFLFTLPCLIAQDRSSARSMVVNRDGIVAASYTQASVAGAQILSRGGSAVDAAIAANAVLNVAEPMMNGMVVIFSLSIGTQKPASLWLELKRLGASEAYDRAFKSQGVTAMPQFGIDSVTVPGAVAGWNALHQRFGHLPWKDLFQPAIFYAENGYPVPELIHGYWASAIQAFANNEEGRRVYLPHATSPRSERFFKILIWLRLCA